MTLPNLAPSHSTGCWPIIPKERIRRKKRSKLAPVDSGGCVAAACNMRSKYATKQRNKSKKFQMPWQNFLHLGWGMEHPWGSLMINTNTSKTSQKERSCVDYFENRVFKTELTLLYTSGLQHMLTGFNICLSVKFRDWTVRHHLHPRSLSLSSACRPAWLLPSRTLTTHLHQVLCTTTCFKLF